MFKKFYKICKTKDTTRKPSKIARHQGWLSKARREVQQGGLSASPDSRLSADRAPPDRNKRIHFFRGQSVYVYKHLVSVFNALQGDLETKIYSGIIWEPAFFFLHLCNSNKQNLIPNQFLNVTVQGGYLLPAGRNDPDDR